MSTRERINIDFDWKFKLADAALAEPRFYLHQSGFYGWAGAAAKLDDTLWRSLNLPHDFVVEREFMQQDAIPNLHISTNENGSKPGGVAWYRKHLSIPESDRGRRIYLFFDGVYRDSEIYLNEFLVGAHRSGYSSFYFDITDLLDYGGENLLAVRVDATQHEGWWYEGGGIYRHVWLVKTGPLHVAPWGTFVTSEVDLSTAKPRARLEIKTTLKNTTGETVERTVRSAALDPSGKAVAEVRSTVRLEAASEVEMLQKMEVAIPQLWSLETPNLYKLETTVLDGKKPEDEVVTPFGIRSVRFDKDRGVLLNGQPVKIKGVCCHQDHAGVGVALPDRLQEYRLERLKDFGCNAYRTSHHPPTPELLDACDRLGMLVLDETRYLSSTEQDLNELADLIRRDRNHPSVVLWSLGNEPVAIAWKPQSARITRTTKALAHKLDPTRPVTLALCFWNPDGNKEEPLDRTPFPAAELDVMGFNYAVDLWEGYHERHPGQPMIITEASSNMRTRGCYRTEDGQNWVSWQDSRTQHRAEEQWDKVARYPYLSGIFLWTGFDYRGEPSPYLWPAINSQFGVLDTCGFPKDTAYYYKAWWTDEPVLHLFPHWNWPERVGQPLTVGCYSNCEEVELFLNGKSLGRQAMQTSSHLEWKDVIYQPGVLEAKGYRDGKVAATAKVETTGASHAIRLTPDRSRIQADKCDVCVLNAEIVDEQGRLVPDASNEISFQVEGPGRIIGVGNGDPGSHEADKSSHRRAFNGLCQAILQATETAGKVTITATAAGLQSASMVVVTK